MLIKSLKMFSGTSLMVQGLRNCLSRQRTWVQSVVWEDPTCHGGNQTHEAQVTQLLRLGSRACKP